jgi:aspartyl protease family protein
VVATAAIFTSAYLFAADAGPKDPFKDNGLTKSASAYVLAEETPELAELKALKTLKADAEKEVRMRTALDLQISAKQKTMKESEKTYRELEARMAAVTNEATKNNMILRMNRMVADHKTALLAVKELEDQAKKITSTNKTKYVDELLKLSAKVSATNEKYAALAANADVKGNLAKANLTANPKLTLGSPEFLAAVDDLKKWQLALESEAIPLKEKNGIFTVEVLLNGETVQMGVDTGASSICLPGEVAEKLKIIPNDMDPVVQIKLADGSVIEGREMNIATVRVGRFTAENVECVVLQNGLPDPAILLGASFLNRYIVKLDAGKKELTLTEVKQTPATGSKPIPAAPPAK